MKQTKTQLWQSIIRNWERTGISQKDFCIAERIAFSTFQYWKKRLESSGEESKFVRVVSEKPSHHEITISFDVGIRMIVPDTVRYETLSRMILAVNEALCVLTGTK
jgi:hypothetical protein